jgi:hypothetical protein
MAWLRMQEHLGQLFVYLMSPQNLQRGWCVWHTIPSDLTQRNCLRALAKLVYPDKKDPICTEILWILEGVQAILDDRNGTIHVAFHIGIDLDANNVRMYSVSDTNNPRSEKMRGATLTPTSI